VLELLDRFNVAYELKPKLVRGLDYYTRTAFEVAAWARGQDAVAGGGAITAWRRSWADRICPPSASPSARIAPGGAAPGFRPGLRPRVFVAALGEPARERAFTVVQELRRKDLAPRWILMAGPSRPDVLADRLGAITP